MYRLFTIDFSRRTLEGKARSIFGLRAVLRRVLACPRIGAKGMYGFCSVVLTKGRREVEFGAWRDRWSPASVADNFRGVTKVSSVASKSVADLFEGM